MATQATVESFLDEEKESEQTQTPLEVPDMVNESEESDVGEPDVVVNDSESEQELEDDNPGLEEGPDDGADPVLDEGGAEEALERENPLEVEAERRRLVVENDRYVYDMCTPTKRAPIRGTEGISAKWAWQTNEAGTPDR